jgi:hypothetical protein
VRTSQRAHHLGARDGNIENHGLEPTAALAVAVLLLFGGTTAVIVLQTRSAALSAEQKAVTASVESLVSALVLGKALFYFCSSKLVRRARVAQPVAKAEMNWFVPCGKPLSKYS